MDLEQAPGHRFACRSGRRLTVPDVSFTGIAFFPWVRGMFRPLDGLAVQQRAVVALVVGLDTVHVDREGSRSQRLLLSSNI